MSDRDELVRVVDALIERQAEIETLVDQIREKLLRLDGPALMAAAVLDRPADPPIIPFDFSDLPEMRFEQIDGVLYIGGRCYGGGDHARVLLDLLREPPDADGHLSPRLRGRVRVLGRDDTSDRPKR